jgi:hypothetical protein
MDASREEVERVMADTLRDNAELYRRLAESEKQDRKPDSATPTVVEVK